MVIFQIIRERQPAQTGLDETTQHCSLDWHLPENQPCSAPSCHCWGYLKEQRVHHNARWNCSADSQGLKAASNNHFF